MKTPGSGKKVPSDKKRKDMPSDMSNNKAENETVSGAGQNFEKMAELSKKTKKNKKRRTIIIIAAIPAVLVALFFILRPIIGPGNNFPDLSYITDTVQRRDITVTLTGSGTLNPADSYTVTSLVPGEILFSDFEEGDIVEKDALLYSIDTSDVENSIERSRLSLERAQLNYGELMENSGNLAVKSNLSGVVTSVSVDPGDNITAGQPLAHVRDSSVMTLRLPFIAADAASMYIGQGASVTLHSSFELLYGTVTKISGADEALAGQMIVRYVTIEVANPGGISPSTMASAQIAGVACVDSGAFEYSGEGYITADTSGKVSAVYIDEGSYVEKGQVVIILSSTNLSSQINSSRLSIRDAELALENQSNQLDNYNITSPISGTIVEKNFKEGDKISSGSGLAQSLCIIFDLTYLEMTLNVDELDISKIKVGQDVRV
ncbi:MAG: biotin/lipoyl-binding protein, partial [Oscillospiraceae bacterium]|nr:biotin/lipoyl-binding protein [Oscillospiraceae bacterium]